MPGDESNLRLLVALDTDESQAGNIVLSNLRRDEIENLRLCARGAVFVAKSSLSPERLEGAIRKVLARPTALPI